LVAIHIIVVYTVSIIIIDVERTVLDSDAAEMEREERKEDASGCG
jgi:hypothetical protein